MGKLGLHARIQVIAYARLCWLECGSSGIMSQQNALDDCVKTSKNIEVYS